MLHNALSLYMYAHAQVLDIRGEWELRRDTGGSVFYRCLDAGAPVPCSWDAPPGWDDPDVHPPASHSSLSTATATTTAAATAAAGSSDAAAAAVSSTALVLSTAAAADNYADSCDSASLLSGSVAHQQQQQQQLQPLTEAALLAATASALAADEHLLEQLAWRLGIPKHQIRPPPSPEPLSPRAAGATATDPSETSSAAGAVELGSEEDLYSDSEDEAGPGPSSLDSALGFLPQNHADRRAQRAAAAAAATGSTVLASLKPGGVPPLQLQGPAGSVQEGEGGGSRGRAWRTLAVDPLRSGFMERICKGVVSGPPQGAADTVPAVRMAGVFDAAQAAKSAAGWRRPPGAPAPVLFVSDIVQEHARVSAIASQRFQYEEVRETTCVLVVVVVTLGGLRVH
jgi:hypothetical protein